VKSLSISCQQSVRRDGFALVHGVLDSPTIADLRQVVEGITNGHEHNRQTYAARNLLGVPEIAALAGSPAIRALVTPLLGERAAAVRGLLFNKVPEANWAVPWHQDLTIAVRERRDAPGFGPWSVKDGVVHVQPPAEVMAGMLAVRIHLDDAFASNGALRVIPGSHTAGRLSAAAIAEWHLSRPAVSIEARAGSILLMQPLLLHASSPAASPDNRRVIHLEYSADRLPFGLDWHEHVGVFEADAS
jgi:ectoine hydroxylase-related dioxygenase (phytanoyl-CoA dioxygenase family)